MAVKYAGITAVILVGFVLFVSRSNYSVSVRELDTEINRRGIALTAVCAQNLEPFWRDDSLPDRDMLDKQNQLHQDLAILLTDPALEGVLDVLVLEDEKNFIASASGSEEFGLADERPIASPEADRAGVSVVSGKLRAGGRNALARSYVRAIKTGEVQVGLVRVFLAAEKIENLKDQLLETGTWTIVVALLVAIPLVVLVGGLLTRPIRVLKNDMSKVASGDLDHQSSIHTGDELESLAVAFNRMTAHLADAQEREVGRKALERELAIATSIQTALLPDAIPVIANHELFPFYQSAKEVGGDYYDFLDLGESRYGIVVADVSGKGIPGSLVMTMTRSLVRMAARERATPAEILTRVNASLSNDMTRGMFVTLMYIELNLAEDTVQLARAGHNPAIWYRSAEQTIEELQPGGIALGMTVDLFVPNLQVVEFRMKPGDFLVLYTDGVIEAMDANAKEYTPERFAGVIKDHASESPREIVQAVLTDVERHTRGAEPSDDITLLVLKRSELS